MKISAKKFSFTPSEVRLKKGEAVILELAPRTGSTASISPSSRSGKTSAPKEVTRVTLTPDKAGTFSFRCDVFCGDGHEDMTGTLIVAE